MSAVAASCDDRTARDRRKTVRELQKDDSRNLSCQPTSGGAMGRSRVEKAATHARIVEITARRFRETGLDGIGVADLMKEAGLTVGGFYKHFASRDELVVEALLAAFKDIDALESRTTSYAQLIGDYLSEAHRDAPGTGCAIGALLGDLARGSTAAKAAYTE